MVNGPTSPVSPLAPYPPIPDPEYRSRAPEFYGFVAWASTYALFVVYVVWALLPDDYIVWLGVDWYPSREWAILVPAWTIVVILLTYFVYFALALYGTPPFSSMSSFTDTRSNFPRPSAENMDPYSPYVDANLTPDLYDIPIGLVNRVVYKPRPHPDLDRKSEVAYS